MRGYEERLYAMRATSFGSHAEEYAKHRPDYPLDGIRWALAGAAGEPRDVLDLAAGTGKLTAGLLTLGLAATAVEPDAGMRAELCHRIPEVTALDGTAEAIPLPDSSMDAVLVGQAFHWFDVPAALSEIARVLRPGGVAGVLWNHDDERVEWVAELIEVSSTSVSGSWEFDDTLPEHPAFHPFGQETFPHSQPRTAESLTATVGTHSHTLVISPAERAELLTRVRNFLAGRPETADGEFELPIRTTVWRGRRR